MGDIVASDSFNLAISILTLAIVRTLRKLSEQPTQKWNLRSQLTDTRTESDVKAANKMKKLKKSIFFQCVTHKSFSQNFSLNVQKQSQEQQQQ